MIGGGHLDTARRREALARERAARAVLKLNEARVLIREAMQELSPIIGAVPCYRQLSRALTEVERMRSAVDCDSHTASPPWRVEEHALDGG